MTYSKADLEMAHDHVAQGERHVALQKQIITHLRELGGSTQLAEELLREFESTLRTHREHCALIEAEVKAG